MLIHLAQFGDTQIDQPVAAFTGHARADTIGAHRLTDVAAEADVILFTQCHMRPDDWLLRRIRAHPLARAHPRKVLVYNELDHPWCALPGVYVNMPASALRPRFQRPWGYFVPPPHPHAAAPQRDLLFSLIASDTAACRRPLFGLSHPAAIVEEVRGFRFWEEPTVESQARRERFGMVLARSRFVLCPRGAGLSSIRLYEALAAGAVPVIIADDWAPPVGPDWEACSVRWPEGRTAGLIELLERLDPGSPGLGAAARRAYDEHFAPGVYFHQVAERCAALIRSGAAEHFPARGVTDRRFAALAARTAGERVRYKLAGAARRARGRRSSAQ